jgi:hypothetical protein
MQYTVEFSFETPTQADAERRVKAMAAAGDALVEMESMSETGGRAILVPQDQFAREDTEIKTLPISRQDAEVCDKALTVTLNWWDVGDELGFLPAEGTPEQIDKFPFQRLMLIAQRYKEA